MNKNVIKKGVLVLLVVLVLVFLVLSIVWLWRALF